MPIISVSVTTCAPGIACKRSLASRSKAGSRKRIAIAVNRPDLLNNRWLVLSGTKNRLSSLVPLRSSTPATRSFAPVSGLYNQSPGARSSSSAASQPRMTESGPSNHFCPACTRHHGFNASAVSSSPTHMSARPLAERGKAAMRSGAAMATAGSRRACSSADSGNDTSNSLPLSTRAAASYGQPSGTSINCRPMRSNSVLSACRYPLPNADKHASTATAAARPPMVRLLRNGRRARFLNASRNMINDARPSEPRAVLPGSRPVEPTDCARHRPSLPPTAATQPALQRAQVATNLPPICP